MRFANRFVKPSLVAEALQQVFEEPASPLLASAAALVVAITLVVAVAFAWTLPTLHFTEEVLGVPLAGKPLAFLHEDAVELAAVEPYAATLRTRVDQDLAPLCLNEP